MERTKNKSGGVYEFVRQEQTESSLPRACCVRSDDSGLWNICKAWYLFLIHLALSVLIMVGVTQIDGLKFSIGSGPTMFTFDSRMYQSQVTGLLSLALVILRLVTGTCSALLAWRIIFVLLKKRGITLAELTRLTNWRVPIIPATKSESSVLWSLWAMTTILLLWPQGFAAPLASSSLSWIPGTTLLKDPSTASIAHIEGHADWASMLYDDMRTTAVVVAAAMTAKDPAYVFQSDQLHLRRYFNTSQNIPTGSRINLTVPYFAVNLRWVDATSDGRSNYAGYAEYSDVNPRFGVRIIGTTAIIRAEKWDAQKSMPSQPTSFVGKKLVSVKLRTLNFGDDLPDGSRANNKTKCPTISDDFGKLPAVNQHQASIVGGEETVAHDCYIFAEATITAGKYSGRECIVTSSDTTSESYATCSIRRDDRAVEEDWLTGLSLDFTSEVLKYAVMQNYSQPWISHNLDDYTSGMLTLGYHAAWSGLMKRLGNSIESVSFRPSVPIVSVSVNKQKLHIWLGINATLTLAAILVFVAQRVSKTKTIRDTAVAALMADLTEIAHDHRATGLCNAVSLSSRDRKLPRLRWERDERKTWNDGNEARGLCSQRVVFVTDAASLNNLEHKDHGVC